MRVSTLGNAAALVSAFAIAGNANALEVHRLHSLEGSPAPFESRGEAEPEGSKPWHVYSDPAYEGVDVTHITFSTGTHTALPTEPNLGHTFPRIEKFPSSHAYGAGSYPEWKHHSHDPYCSPVPEPQTYALLLAGLGAMTIVARRRKAQPSPTPA